MKIIATSNFAIETIADQLIGTDLTEEEAWKKVNELNEEVNEYSMYFYRVVQDDYVLWKGIEELI